MTEQGNWQTCIVDTDYEIFSEFPHQIRRKSNKRIIKESITQYGYIYCNLNNHKYFKHVLVALQFIPNDDPEHKTEVDHKNNDRTDFHISNLRWLTHKENMQNVGFHNGVAFETIEQLPDDAIEVDEYCQHHFDSLFFANNSFYQYNGLKYRKLVIKYDRGFAYSTPYNSNGKRVKVSFNKFKRLYGIEF